MIFKYIDEELPYNKELDSQIGINYANNGKSIRYSSVDVEIDSWIEEHNDVHECESHGDCVRCANNNGFDSEFIEIHIVRKNKTFSFVRHKSHQLGGVWSNWYDNSYAITPAK